VIPHGVEVFVCVEPVDMRLGFDRLAGLAEERVQRPVRSRALFLFFGKRKSALKLLFFDGSGLCVFTNVSTADSSASPKRWMTVG
jgi:transposase